MFLLTAQTMKRLDQIAIEEIGIPGLLLMENAGRAVAELVLEEGGPGGVSLVLCGTGNNGGDGLVAARHLLQASRPVKVWVAGERMATEDARRELTILERSGFPPSFIPGREEDFLRDLQSADGLVDALFGIGISREITGPMRRWMEMVVRHLPKRVIAVDLPSGIGADDGKVYGIAIPATRTVTFTAAKWGHFLREGAKYTGRLTVAEISIPAKAVRMAAEEMGKIHPYDEVLTEEAVRPLLPSLGRFTHKGSYGHALIVGGSRHYPGAPLLAALAALRAGAGLVTLGVPESLSRLLPAHAPDPIYLPLPEEGGHLSDEAWEILLAECKHYSVLAIGPGLSRWEKGEKGLAKLIGEVRSSIILDADALNLLARDPSILKEKKGEILLTPHPGEMARLVGNTVDEIEENRPGWARRFATRYGVYLLLKGSYPLIATPQGKIYLNPRGSEALAKGGSGDVLTGLIAGFAVQKGNLLESALLASYLHGLIGEKMLDKGGRTLYSSEILSFVPEVIAEHMTL